MREIKAHKSYVRAVIDSVHEAGFNVFDASSHRTGSGRIAVKVEIRSSVDDNDTRSNTQNVSDNLQLREKIVQHLTQQGYRVIGVRSSWFSYGRGPWGENAVTFHFASQKG